MGGSGDSSTVGTPPLCRWPINERRSLSTRTGSRDVSPYPLADRSPPGGITVNPRGVVCAMSFS